MNNQSFIDGLILKTGPLGEKNRLLTVITKQQGIIKVSAPGARKIKSPLAGAVPLVFINIELSGKRQLKNILKVLLLLLYMITKKCN